MNLVMFKLFLLFTFYFTISLGWRSDYKYYKKVNGWLKFHEISTTFHEAFLRCFYEGSRLASPVPELIETMKDIMLKNNIPSRQIFTGIHATYYKREFSSVEGLPLSDIPHKWAEGEPDNKGNDENCITMSQHSTLSDVNCNSSYPYICYKKNDAPQPNSCGIYDDGYVLDRRTGSYYKFHRDPHTWYRAYMICQAEGGYLVIINNGVEAQIVKELLEKNPAASLPPTAYNDTAFVGMHDVDEHAEWLSIHGETLTETGYDKFKVGEPNSFVSSVRCGAVYRTGLLDDDDCNRWTPFICEKDPQKTQSVCDED